MTHSEKQAEQLGPVLEGPGAKRTTQMIQNLLNQQKQYLINKNNEKISQETAEINDAGSIALKTLAKPKPLPLFATSKIKVLEKLGEAQIEMINKSKRYSSEQNVKTALLKQNASSQQQNQLVFHKNHIQRQQALALMCRIYIGSINFEVKEETIKTAFLPFGPIRSISMSYDPLTQRHKGFAFLEYETPEAGELAVLQMTGVLMGGRNIKVGRPSNMPQAQPIIEEIKEEGKNFNRLYVASIHTDLNSDDIKSVFEAFGTIKCCKLAPIPMTTKHKGYGYIEYETKQACEDAITSMNLFDLGGQFLRVGKAVTPPSSVSPLSIGVLPPSLSPSALLFGTGFGTPDFAVSESLGAETEESSNKTPELNSAKNDQVTAQEGKIVKGIVIPSLMSINLPPPPPLLPLELTNAILSNNAHLSQMTNLTNGIFNSTNLKIPNISNSISDKIIQDAKSKKSFDESQDLLEINKKRQKLDDSEDVIISGRKARHMVMQKLMKKTESKVLVLKNMVGPEDIDSLLEGEVTEECSKYGKVTKVLIHQEIDEYGVSDPETGESDIIVKIFVEFLAHEDVLRAKEALNGRYFGGRSVVAEAYDQIAYNDNDLSL
ncbi:unnamed protein product [Gordionus sp. m RMFG-2023]